MSVIRIALLSAGVLISATVAWGQSATTPTLPSQSRDELKRRWDLNNDGQIDEAEADMARTKMRRERMDLLQRGSRGVAKPSTAPAAEQADTGNELVFPDMPPAAPPKSKQPVDKDAATEPKKVPSWSSAREPAPPPKKDLNAGRLPAGLPQSRGLPPGTPPPSRIGGGLVPSINGGPSIRTPQPQRPPAMRATRPTPTFPARPRVSAEEIGGP